MIQDTAYPRLRSQVSQRELTEIYTPTAEELTLARQVTKGAVAQLGFLVQLKTFQRLGYFPALSDIPPRVVAHLGWCAGWALAPADLSGYGASGTRRRHLQVIREYLGVKPYGRPARRVLVEAMKEAARTKDELADLINIALEELIRQQWELPAFSTLQRAALHVRALVYRGYYRQVAAALSDAARQQLQALLETEATMRRSAWNELKQGPGSSTLGHFKVWVTHYQWLTEQSAPVRAALAGVPDVKVKHFAAEAKTLDAARIQALEPQKRATLVAALLVVQSARVLDELAEMFIKRMGRIHQRGKEALAQHREQEQKLTDHLIGTLRELVTAYHGGGTEAQRLAAMGNILGGRSDEVIQQCDAHQAYAGNNYHPFLWRFYVSHRATLFRLLPALRIQSTSQDTSLVEALDFLRQHESNRGEWLPLPSGGAPEDASSSAPARLDLSWVPESWWCLVSGGANREERPERINRRHFEVCVFSQMIWDLKSGDLCLDGSDQFADYRQQLISWEEYAQMVPAYREQVGLPVEGPTFVAYARQQLEAIAAATDAAFPQNEQVRIEQGEPIISRSERPVDPEQLQLLQKLMAARMEPVTILDVLGDTERWLNWTRFFGPISGHDAKVDNPRERYVLTTFCFGCNLGPSQAARALGAIERRQLAWINQRHITEDKLDQVITELVNGYSRFELPRHWGSGQHASADGTKWDLYEQNLLSEYHIRYGGYGGIGYYHVSDTYVALFSHFIPCGAGSGKPSTFSMACSRIGRTFSRILCTPTRKGKAHPSSALRFCWESS